MEVHVHSSTIIAQGNPNAEPSEVPFTIFDRFAINIHVAVLFAFTPPTPTNSALTEALSKTLVHFPTLTGRFGYSHRNRPCLLIGGRGGGALVVEATVASSLSDHLPLEPSPDFELLHPPRKEAKHLLQVQLNRFKCGGLVIAVTAHHKVADGQSMSTFFIAWGQTVRGMPIDRLPVYDQSWLKPQCPPKPEFQHWGTDFEPIQPNQDGFTVHRVDVDPARITNILLRYSSEYITGKLKANMKEKHTTFETLLGHVWRKITIARGLDDSEYTVTNVAVNCRPRLKPAVPSEFFGNLVLDAYAKASVKQLIEGGLAEAARLIHEAAVSINRRFIQSFIDFGAMYEDEDLVLVYELHGNMLSPIVEANSWLGFKFQDVDIGGGGKLQAFLPSWIPVEGMVMFLPGVDQGGGIDVFVSLLEEHAQTLRQISHSLD
ncbi:tryptamine hydroxycinnamoyltransferase 1-like [Elaeis guineensis]|uniref:Tryptamine hydroxycinnamoyltransferase 1-like n=1 Tax=Elaeis guineensis var. tenera TaxID=51953 RepID=A0A6I9R7Y4_ELAGV|nr:tryptamine hydroxycinnamoyltransferase 1-like [Elaeis guineensis]